MAEVGQEIVERMEEVREKENEDGFLQWVEEAIEGKGELAEVVEKMKSKVV